MERFDLTPVLAGLKDFQRATVDYVFDRLYGADPTTRFLVADEVGLGKTLVARGLIARIIDHLHGEDQRVDIVYVCSNADIARQNLRRLNVTDRTEFAFEHRLTMLASHVGRLREHKLNLVAFTPGTSFDLKSSMGQKEERASLWWILRALWGPSAFRGKRKGVVRLFQGGVSSLERMQRIIAGTEMSVDPTVLTAFQEAIATADHTATAAGDPTFYERFTDLASRWSHDLKRRPNVDYADRNRFVGDLRAFLARACLQALQPRLVILDEFQRFKSLLDGESDAAVLAHELFTYSDGEGVEARTLLLSATPYKMFTLSEEADTDDHYVDFLRTTKFLKRGDIDEFEADLAAFRRSLFRLGSEQDAFDEALAAKDRVEAQLRRVMCRTERLAITRAQNGMLTEIEQDGMLLDPSDPAAYITLQRVAAELGAGDHLEYWKSTPYFLNYVDGYKLGNQMSDAMEDPAMRQRLLAVLAKGEGLIDWDDYVDFKQIEAGNPRLRSLLARTTEVDAWKLLWIPPSLPYYEHGPPYNTPAVATFTKQLIFSAWQAAPRAIATLTSYDAEHRMMRQSRRPNTSEGRAKITDLLRFTETRGRLAGMPVLAFVYPSLVLARVGDPLRRAAETDTFPLPLKELRARVKGELRELLAPHLPETSDGRTDEAWYWAAPFLLDHAEGHDDWLRSDRPMAWWPAEGSERGSVGLEKHLDRARDLIDGDVELGTPPSDLLDVLADLAIAGPAVAAVRALSRVVAGDDAEASMAVRSGAARIGFEFRNLFNLPAVQYLIRQVLRGKEPHWRKALRYCVHGNLQSVLDEFSHVFREWLGLLEVTSADHIETLAKEMASVVSLRAVDYEVRDPMADEWEHGKQRIRIRFAAPFGHHREEAGQLLRAATVRTAFNSPFWPFVLASTSVGQEGLDFHLYCHAVVHWNLPSNPVDLEQREGRVHRYKGHAVRRNLAAGYAAAAGASQGDPWEAMFDAATEAREDGENDLVPFWVLDGPATIQRHVPALPLSREVATLSSLKQSLALYRLVFGQARQEDLVQFLEGRNLGASDGALLGRLSVDLTPTRATRAFEA